MFIIVSRTNGTKGAKLYASVIFACAGSVHKMDAKNTIPKNIGIRRKPLDICGFRLNILSFFILFIELYHIYNNLWYN